MQVQDVQSYTEIALQVVGMFSVVAAVTPTPVDNAALLTLRKFIELGALNVLFAKRIKHDADKAARGKDSLP